MNRLPMKLLVLFSLKNFLECRLLMTGFKISSVLRLERNNDCIWSCTFITVPVIWVDIKLQHTMKRNNILPLKDTTKNFRASYKLSIGRTTFGPLPKSPTFVRSYPEITDSASLIFLLEISVHSVNLMVLGNIGTKMPVDSRLFILLHCSWY